MKSIRSVGVNLSPIFWGVIVGLLMLSACASMVNPESRAVFADRLAKEFNWTSSVITTDYFDLLAYLSPTDEHSVRRLYVYIEGDGLAWKTRSSPSLDPTPLNPISLKLAVRHSGGVSAYLARPCQYVDGKHRRNCNARFWTDSRFSQYVINSMNQAVEVLKQHYQSSELVLIGYSGGGAVAALMAAHRQDVVALVSVAGNLDHRKWTEIHGLSPLGGSLNPADYWANLASIPQLHLIGGRDQVITLAVLESFRDHFSNPDIMQIMTLEKYSHSCCWERGWSQISTLKMMR